MLSRNLTLIRTYPSKNTTTRSQSLDDLITALTTEAQTEYNKIIRTLDLPANVYREFYSWCDDSYTRNCIAENEKFELILLCWKPGQKTPIHDHGGEECWVKVIQGAFKETIYALDDYGALNMMRSRISKTNEVSYMIDFMGFHSLENLSPERSISLHLYAKPIRNCNVFDAASRKFVNKELSYNTVAQEVAD